MMTRKHYELVAKILKHTDMSDSLRFEFVSKFAGKFAEDNPRFDYVKFVAACTPACTPAEQPERPPHCTRRRMKPFMDDCECEYCEWLDNHIMGLMKASD